MRIVHALSLSLFACNISLGAVGFDIPYDVPAQTVPGNAAANAAGVVVDLPPTTFPVNVDVAAQAKANGVDGVISTVTMTSLSFTMTGSGCFDFIDGLSLSISSTKSGTTLPSAVVATGASPGCVTTFPLDVVTTVNLKPYLDEGSSITMTGSGIPPAADVTFDGALSLHAGL